MIYKKLQYRQNYSFGDILRKFDGSWTFLIDSVCLLSFRPKICIFHAALQMLCRGQNCQVCHTESCGMNDVTSLIKLQLTLFFSTHKAYLYSNYISLLFLKKFKILQNDALVTIALIWLTL